VATAARSGAALFHDAIYQPAAADNETRSAQLARATIDRWLPDRGIDTERVAAHRADCGPRSSGPDSVDTDAALFLTDMAILGADPLVFDAYERAIAAEYAAVPAAAFREGRRCFLEGLLACPRITTNHSMSASTPAPAPISSAPSPP
jgi:predicted metal-dependent HD superfamily phosphohydrolase